MGGENVTISSVVSQRLHALVKTVLDRTGDGVLDQTEASPAQMKLLSGKEGEIAQVTVDEVIVHAEENCAGDPAKCANFFRKVFESNDGGYLDLSGYSAYHIGRKLGLVFKDCKIAPSDFENSLVAYFKNEKLPEYPTFEENRPTSAEAVDRYTFSNYDKTNVSHVSLDLTANFEDQRFEGTATLTIGKQLEDKLVLDTQDLAIDRVWVAQKDSEVGFVGAKFELGEEDKPYGRALTVHIPENTEKVIIRYKTGKGRGLHWLKPEQTFSGKKPFMFTQSQMINARSWMPVQDTTLKRIMFDAKIRVASDLGVRFVISSGEKISDIPMPNKSGGHDVWETNVPQPVLPYILGITAGELEGRKVGEGEIVYAEPHMIDAAEAAFKRYSGFAKVAEKLFGPHPFGSSSAVIMPPSFPYGGMENLGANFDSNFVISEGNIPAHETGHNWFGNTLGYATHDDLWFNEGWTTWFQRRLVAGLMGSEAANLNAALGRSGIEGQLGTVGNSHNTCLAAGVDFKDPEDIISNQYTLVYEKSYLFITWLQEKFGGEGKFDKFAGKLLADRRFKNMTAEDFVQYILSNKPAGLALSRYDIEEWLYAPGLPYDAPEVKSVNKSIVDRVVASWTAPANTDFTIRGSNKWTPEMWNYFLGALAALPSVPKDGLDVLRNRHNLDESNALETAALWYSVVARNSYEPSFEGLKNYLDGRMLRARYVVKILAYLVLSNNMPLAKEIYEKIQPKLHPITDDYVKKSVFGEK